MDTARAMISLVSGSSLPGFITVFNFCQVSADGQSKDDTEEDDDFKYHVSIRPNYFRSGTAYITKFVFSKTCFYNHLYRKSLFRNIIMEGGIIIDQPDNFLLMIYINLGLQDSHRLKSRSKEFVFTNQIAEAINRRTGKPKGSLCWPLSREDFCC